MNWLNALSESLVVQRAGWTLLHSSWQELAIALGLALVLPAIRNRGACAAYAACSGALALTIVLPAVTFFLVPLDASPIASLSAAPTVAPILSHGGQRPQNSAVTVERATSPGTVPKAVVFVADVAEPSTLAEPAGSKGIASPPAVNVIPTINERIASLWRQISAVFSASAPWLVAFWTVGVLALSVWNAGGWFAVQRLKSRDARPVSAAIQQAAARLSQQLGLSRGVRLLQSAVVESPVVVGVLKPVILLPASLMTGLPTDQLESLLAHELAHVLRRDYLVNLLQTAIETLLFYHPAVWWISAKVREERENCCDDLAIGVTRDRTIYLRALAAVAGARSSALAPAASGGVLVRRLRRILGAVDPPSVHPSRWLTGAAILSLCGAAIALWAVDTRAARAQAKPAETVPAKSTTKKDQTNSKPVAAATGRAKRRKATGDPEFPTKGSMQIHVVDTAGKPLEKTRIHASIWTSEEKFKANRDYSTDAKGFATVQLPKTLQILRLWANKDGYRGKFKNFQTNSAVHVLVIPDDFQFRLIKGTLIGGIVKNEDGRPIKGAKVAYCYDGVFFNDDTLTDENGRWKFDDVGPEKEVFIRVTHPDYISDHRAEMQKAQKITTAMLRAQTATIVMRRGVRIVGKVTDPAAKPVSHAILLTGDDPYFGSVTQPVVTDQQGQFQFPVMAAGSMRVTVIAKGWMPDTRVISIAPGTQPVNFQLRLGKKMRIRFTDRHGKSIPTVAVQVEEWHGVRHLVTEPNWKIKLPIPEQANGDGVYEWDWAPDDVVKLNLSGEGYGEMRLTPFTADGREHVQVLNPILQISGTVRDATSGKPIDNFLALPVIYFRPDFASLERNGARQESEGQFALEFDRTDVEHGVQIEAFGYRTFRTSKGWRSGDTDANLDIRLEPSPRYVGTMVDAEGRLVHDARLYRSTVSEQFSLYQVKELRDSEYDENHRIQTDGKGGFEIAAPIEKYTLIAMSRDAYGEVTRASSDPPGQIRLARWAKVTGRLVQSGKPMPNCNVMLSTIRPGGGGEPHVFINLQTQSREDGSFTFERVPSGPCHVRGWLHFSAASPLTSSESVPLQLVPGQAVDVPLGAAGIDVTGQLVALNQPPGFDYHFAINDLLARQPGIDPPAFLAGKGFDWQKGWSDAFQNSPEGRAYLETLHTWFVKPEPDGRFRITGVPPGEYDFAVHLYGSTEGCLVHPIAQRVVHFSVKPGDTKLDLGKLSIPSITLPKVGDVASDFAFETPAGQKTSLTALRGNYVLVDFWATWCAPCVAKLDQVEHLREQFQGDKPLLIVGANLDAERDRARDFLKTKPLPWQHALLGDWSSTDVPRRFAISTVPAYVLIGPDGRILAHEFALEAIESKLQAIKATNRERQTAH